MVAVSLLRDSSTHTQEMYLEGISDYYCVLPEGKHRNCQLIQPFQKFKKQSNLLPLIFHSSPVTSAFLFSFSQSVSSELEDHVTVRNDYTLVVL